jgi:hypothetical protein
MLYALVTLALLGPNFLIGYLFAAIFNVKVMA